MMVWPLFIIDLMGLFFYNKIGSIISIGDLPTTNIIEPQNELSDTQNSVLFAFLSNLSIFKIYNKEFLKSKSFCPRLFGKTVEFQKLLQILNFTYHFNDLDCLHFILICFTVISRRKSSPLFKNFSKVRIIIIPYLTRYL